MAAEQRNISGLPEMIQAVYDALAARGASVECEFDNVEVLVPSGAGPNAPQARWRVNGKLRVHASDGSTARPA